MSIWHKWQQPGHKNKLFQHNIKNTQAGGLQSSDFLQKLSSLVYVCHVFGWEFSGKEGKQAADPN